MKSNVMHLHKDNYFPSQWEFLTNKPKCRIKAYIGGMGSGKTFSLLSAVFIAHITKKNNEGKSNGLVLYPTYSLAEEVFIEPFKDMLERNGIDYDYNIAAHKFRTAYGNIKIYQTRYPQRIVGASYTFCGIDELDTEPFRQAELVVQKVLGRLRGCEDAELFITSTPEGFSYCHHLLVEKAGPDKLLVHGKTTDNKYLPESYIQSLRDNYDENLLKAYLHGRFVNLQKGSTYAFEREKNVKECLYSRGQPIYVGMDFNCYPMAAVIIQEQSHSPEIKVIGEILLAHQGNGDLLTKRMCDTIKHKYPNSQYHIFPDATGASKHSSSRFSDIELIRRTAKFNVHVKHINPLVINRVNSVNNNLNKGNMIIDPSCKELIKDLEQVVNKEGTRDIDKSNSRLSHLSDALGYYCDFRKPTIKPSFGTQDR